MLRLCGIQNSYYENAITDGYPVVMFQLPVAGASLQFWSCPYVRRHLFPGAGERHGLPLGPETAGPDAADGARLLHPGRHKLLPGQHRFQSSQGSGFASELSATIQH